VSTLCSAEHGPPHTYFDLFLIFLGLDLREVILRKTGQEGANTGQDTSKQVTI
jgi:hypothetical protein